jgi:glycosyltransferase involved in cell wall biosynthesis
VLAQTYSNWEYTIVNNCSTDGTLQIIEEYVAKDNRIRVHNNDKLLDIVTANVGDMPNIFSFAMSYMAKE